MATSSKATTPPARSASTETPTEAATGPVGDAPVVSDAAVDLPIDTGAAANEAATTAPDGELHDVNPATVPGDNLAPNQTLTENAAGLPSSGTGFHCGYCGQQIGAEGQHYDGNGEQVTVGHAGTLVVADNWAAGVQQGDAQAEADRRSDRGAKLGNTK